MFHIPPPPHIPRPSYCQCVPRTHLLQMTILPCLVHHNYPKSIVYMKVHSWWYIFYGFGQMYKNMYSPLQNHTEYFYFPENPLYSTYSSHPLQTFGIHWSLYSLWPFFFLLYCFICIIYASLFWWQSLSDPCWPLLTLTNVCVTYLHVKCLLPGFHLSSGLTKLFDLDIYMKRVEQSIHNWWCSLGVYIYPYGI